MSKQIDIFEAIQQSEADEAIHRAGDAQERKVDGWHDQAIELLKQYSHTVEDFLTEDFRVWAEEKGLPEPEEPRAYGSLIRRAKTMNLIEPTGQFRRTVISKSHGRPMMVWKPSMNTSLTSYEMTKKAKE
jgi:hypothetical protein